ncbi:2',3'-cyclic-nucleotide 3'-phosphodiesterase, partial [Pisolithus marmoratus]
IGLSFWLVPPPCQATLLQSIMPQRPQGRTLSPSSYPKFFPHITLASVRSGNELPGALLVNLARDRQSIRVNFQSVVVSDHYFRSLLVSVLPTADLLALAGEIKETLSHLSPLSAPMFPHLSLAYITDEDAEAGERDRAAQSLRESSAAVEDESNHTVSLQCGEVCLSGIDLTEIWLVDCEGPVEDWSVRDKVSLTDV